MIPKLALLAMTRIVVRHDVDAEKFIADPSDFPSVFEVFPGDGMATVIATDWAITAAHVAELLAGNNDHEVFVSGQRVKIDRVVPHPGWSAETLSNDLALLHFIDAGVTVRRTAL